MLNGTVLVRSPNAICNVYSHESEEQANVKRMV